MEDRCPGMAEHVCAKVWDTAAHRQTLEELSDPIAGQWLAVPVGEERRVVVAVAVVIGRVVI